MTPAFIRSRWTCPGTAAGSAGQAVLPAAFTLQPSLREEVRIIARVYTFEVAPVAWFGSGGPKDSRDSIQLRGRFVERLSECLTQ